MQVDVRQDSFMYFADNKNELKFSIKLFNFLKFFTLIYIDNTH